ncbi:hypothetical protein [Paenibacillus assamensis]|uniref:hypothetical protein n=1 Tax=Paenibacillus assamensis TaxID=311244 RepID=UPI00042A1334|nr:hypothetical protein [Paenibacillus assamensis]
MFEVSCDVSKNRLYIKLEGMMSMEEAREYEKALYVCVSQMQEGYTLCFDMVNAQPGKLEVNNSLADIRAYMAEKKIKGTAMIVGNVLSKLQLTRLLKEIGGTFNVVQGYEDAEKYLDSI